MTRHVHADHIIAAANDTSIKWDCRPLGTDKWDKTFNPQWAPDYEYRQRPKAKKTVDLYLWAYKMKGAWYPGNEFFKDENEFRLKRDYVIDKELRRLDYTKVIVEVDE